MPRTAPENTKDYDKFCNQLSKRRDTLGISQSEIAKRARYRNPNFISMVENKASGIPIKNAGDFALAYQLDQGQFAKALIKTRYPEFWDLFIFILESDSLVPKDKLDEFNQSASDFINRIDRLPRSATK
jgi:transcriptional regulator with XRE-family HTH domain